MVTMPRIVLKHKSPEYADTENVRARVHSCEMPDCQLHAEHKAPKHRTLNEYYWFCLEHVRAYNAAWNFFSGMSEQEMQEHMDSSLYGDRPTWRYAGSETIVDALHRGARQTYFHDEPDPSSEKKRKQQHFQTEVKSAEFEAMAIMGLEPPVTLEDIKTRYKTLAKKYHPDLNRNNPEAEELLKRINMAYTILKLAYEEYKRLPDHKF